MQTSTRLDISYPNTASETDSADIPRDIATLVSWLDIAGLIYWGLIAARPVSTPGSPGIIGRFFWATDTLTLWFDFGTGWNQIYPVAAEVDMGLLVALT